MKLLMVLLLITISVNSQVTQKWVQRYNGTANGYDYAVKVVIDKFTGDVYTGGRAYNTGSDYDIVIIKYNSSGSQQWLKTYNGIGNGYDWISDMILDNLGNLIITGTSYSPATGLDYQTIKYTTSGTRMWVKRYNGPENLADHATVLSVDGMSGDIYVSGYSEGKIGGYVNKDIVTVKYSYDGTEQWVQRYNGTDNSTDETYSMTSDNSGNIYVAGYSYSAATNYDFVTIKYNPQGSAEWIRKINSPGVDIPYKILTNYHTNDIVVLGNDNSTLDNFIMVCYDYSGNMKWSEYNISGLSNVQSAVIDNIGSIIVSGYANLSGTASDYITIKYNPAGGLNWYNRYDGTGSGDDYPHDVTVDAFNNVYITGYSKGVGSGTDCTTIKYNQAGIFQWEKRYNFTGAGSNYGYSVAADNSGNVYVTGPSANVSGILDFATIKYSQGQVFGKLTTGNPAEFKLYSNYPNPFNPATSIKFDISKESDVKIVIYDLTGKEINTLVDEKMNAGSYEVSFNASILSSGTYFYKMEAGDFTDVKKMILIK